VREVFLPVAASLGELAGALAAGGAPWDYYAAIEQQRGQSDSK
jgi:hypothetical protein